MRNRVITVPISKEAEKRLDYDECFDDDLIEYNLSEKEFIKLFEMGFFYELNNSLGLMNDDYEWEEILEDKLDALKIFMEFYTNKHPNNKILKNLNELFEVAYKKKTGVFFFL